MIQRIFFSCSCWKVLVVLFVCLLRPTAHLWDALHFMGTVALENGRRSCGTLCQPFRSWDLAWEEAQEGYEDLL